jgi:hypothetical protein
LVEGKPIEVICRELGRARNSVRNMLRSEATEFQYQGATRPMPKVWP